LDCYEDPPKMVDDTANGKYYVHAGWDKKTCASCQKWEYTKKSCAAKDKAADEEDCHQYGDLALDKLCWNKIEDKDTCACKTAECAKKPSVEEGLTFGADHKCPKNHRRKKGVSICMTERDICLPCPPVSELAGCKNVGEYVKETVDCNGCTIKKCYKSAMKAEEGGCECNEYKFIAKDHELWCHCTKEQKEKVAARINAAEES